MLGNADRIPDGCVLCQALPETVAYLMLARAAALHFYSNRQQVEDMGAISKGHARIGKGALWHPTLMRYALSAFACRRCH
ncbi:MAG: hypothetical protein MUC60_11635 [Oscillatoria sp. Prado101]|jgi:hypothetical protein|nr:hypothetical protein [Oscillatoria sp. Prado101]